MDAIHMHLLLNHFPILGTLFGAVLLGFGIFLKKNTLTNAGLIMLIAMAAITPVVANTGKGAEETIEAMPGISERYIETHEELGKTATWVMIGLGGLALITLLINRWHFTLGRVMAVLTLVGSLGVFGLMAKVGNTGGEIRHTEIRTGAAATPTAQRESPKTEQPTAGWSAEAGENEESEQDED